MRILHCPSGTGPRTSVRLWIAASLTRACARASAFSPDRSSRVQTTYGVSVSLLVVIVRVFAVVWSIRVYFKRFRYCRWTRSQSASIRSDVTRTFAKYSSRDSTVYTYYQDVLNSLFPCTYECDFDFTPITAIVGQTNIAFHCSKYAWKRLKRHYFDKYSTVTKTISSNRWTFIARTQSTDSIRFLYNLSKYYNFYFTTTTRWYFKLYKISKNYIDILPLSKQRLKVFFLLGKFFYFFLLA